MLKETSSNTSAIKVTNLSKVYPLYNSSNDRLKEALHPMRKKYHRDFYALRDVSFEVEKGETVGIIGQNGSGKSTLLKILSNVLTPTSGSCAVNGKVSSLLELGTGFNPELTGVENVYFSGTLLGFTKEEMDAKLDDILNFADIGDFVRQPVKTYSSGMYVRLAFAVVVYVEADILLIDEALSVGDVFFQHKCMRSLTTFQQEGGTILFVSHDTSAIIRLCNRAILLPNGNRNGTIIGTPEEVCKVYLHELYAERVLLKDSVTKQTAIDSTLTNLTKDYNSSFENIVLDGLEQPENQYDISDFRTDADSFGEGGMKIKNVWFENKNGIQIKTIKGGDLATISMYVETNIKIKWPAFGIIIKDRLGQFIFAESTDMPFRQYVLSLKQNETVLIKFTFTMPILIHGEYTINVAAAEGPGNDHFQHHWIHDALTLTSLKSRLVHGICGLQNLTITMQINENK